MDILSKAAGTLVQAAPAKVNLSLHVVGRRTDGYHLLDGLVAFAALGDRVTLDDASTDSLRIVGPMAHDLSPDGPNILRTTLAFARRIAGQRNATPVAALALTLEKNLPVAAGIGGGSADAAALLRALCIRHPVLAPDLRAQSVTLGADVPMCVSGHAARVTGVGDIVEPLARLPALPMVLVNPRVPLSTPAVFAQLGTPSGDPVPAFPASGFFEVEALCAYLAHCRNDLESAAISVVPSIAEALGSLRANGAMLARMSGSGATTFGIFSTRERAATAAKAIAAGNPAWWVAATTTFPAEA